jgi:hypothetical protein
LPDALTHALAYAAQGWPVFPVWWLAAPGACACSAGRECPPKQQAKHPIPPRGHNDASTDPEQIAKWWSLAPAANVGVAVPDGYAVVDIDPRNDGVASLEALEAQHGPLPGTRTATTGGGGLHFWFRLPPGLALPGQLGAGVDVKQLGGYVLAPPSNHASGGVYAWASAPDAPIADAPAWLVALGRPRGERATVIIEDDSDERTVGNAELDGIIADWLPQFVEGKKHYLCKALGGWLKQRGYAFADVRYVVGGILMSLGIEPSNGLGAARWAYNLDKPNGWHELRGLVGADVAAQLEARTPNPKRAAEVEAASTVGAALVANAVARPEAPAPPPPAAPLILTPGARVAGFTPWDLSRAPPPLSYIVPELELASGRCNMLAGYSNAGKTAVAQALAFAVAMGLPAWGRFAVTRTRVLHLDYEAGLIAHENYARLANAYGVDPAHLREWLEAGEAGVYLDNPHAEAWLLDIVRAYGAGLVILDVLRAASGRYDENKAEIAQPLYMLGRVSKATGAAFIALHHERKPDGEKRTAAEHMISGHNAIHGALQMSMSLIRDDKSGTVEARSSKRIRAGFDPFSLKFVDVPAPGADSSPGALIARAGEPSWGLRVETVAPKAAPEPELDPIEDAARKILAFLAERAPDGRYVRADAMRAEVKARWANQTAAIERLAGVRLNVRHGPPRTVALMAPVGPGLAERPIVSFAPPAVPVLRPPEDLTSGRDLVADYGAGLLAAAPAGQVEVRA